MGAEKKEGPVIEVPKSREEAEALLGQIADNSILLKSNAALLAIALQAAKDKFDPDILRINQEIDAQRSALQKWAENEKIGAGDKRSLEMLRGTIGFRQSRPALDILANFTWPKALAGLKGAWKKYVRVKWEIDKASILRDASGPEPKLTREKLSKKGFKIVSSDTFYVELKEK